MLVFCLIALEGDSRDLKNRFGFSLSKTLEWVGVIYLFVMLAYGFLESIACLCGGLAGSQLGNWLLINAIKRKCLAAVKSCHFAGKPKDYWKLEVTYFDKGPLDIKRPTINALGYSVANLQTHQGDPMHRCTYLLEPSQAIADLLLQCRVGVQLPTAPDSHSQASLYHFDVYLDCFLRVIAVHLRDK